MGTHKYSSHTLIYILIYVLFDMLVVVVVIVVVCVVPTTSLSFVIWETSHLLLELHTQVKSELDLSFLS